MGGTRPGGRPASAVRWRREASTDHSHEGGANTVDAFPFTLQDHGPGHPRRVATTCGPGTTPQNCETRGVDRSWPGQLARQSTEGHTPPRTASPTRSHLAVDGMAMAGEPRGLVCDVRDEAAYASSS